GFWCPTLSGGDHFLLRHRHCVEERLHRRLAGAPAPLMGPRLIVLVNPDIEIGLQLVDETIHLFAERDTVKLIEHGLVEALADAVGLRALGLSARVINVLDREVEFVLVPLWIAAVLATAVGQHAEQPNLVTVEEGDHAIVEEIGCRDRWLAIIELGASSLGVGVDERLLVDASDPLQIADIERVLGAAVARMLALEF